MRSQSPQGLSDARLASRRISALLLLFLSGRSASERSPRSVFKPHQCPKSRPIKPASDPSTAPIHKKLL